MRRGFLAMLAAGMVTLLVYLATTEADQSFTLGVISTGVAVDLPGGQRVCQRFVDVPETGTFQDVRIIIGTHFRPRGPRVPVVVTKGDPSGEVMARGVLPGGYPDIYEEETHTIHLDHEIVGGEVISLCFTNTGTKPLAFFGGPQAAPRGTFLETGGPESKNDLDLVFSCGCDRSKLSRLGDELENASLFKYDFGGPWASWLWLIAVVAVVPALLALAAGRAARARD